MIEAIDRLFVRVRGVPFLWRLTLFTRIMLAAGFLPTGLVKLLGRRFTTMPVDTEIGRFFEMLYQSGPYWRFIGASQVVAALLLLHPRTAHLGALLFLPIMANIFVVTVAFGFSGTPFVTGAMLLAVVWLCAWDYDRARGLVTERPWRLGAVPRPELDGVERVAFVVFGVSLITVFTTMRSLLPVQLALPLIAIGALAGLVALVRFVLVGRRLAPAR